MELNVHEYGICLWRWPNSPASDSDSNRYPGYQYRLWEPSCPGVRGHSDWNEGCCSGRDSKDCTPALTTREVYCKYKRRFIKFLIMRRCYAGDNGAKIPRDNQSSNFGDVVIFFNWVFKLCTRDTRLRNMLIITYFSPKLIGPSRELWGSECPHK